MDMVVADRLTKTYRIGVGRARVREMLPWPIDRAISRRFPRWWARDTFDALESVSLTVPAGSSVGIVGHNGAGKTTLLRVIAGVTAPTRGRVTTSGRVGALLEVLVGFHPDLTGVENSYLLGAMLGLGRKEMSSRLPRIMEFAELGDLADTPVKRYSAGMLARLGFSTLVAIEPELLLVDEVLAVGDAAFQRKCAEWLDDYHERGGTLLFVSHNLGLVRSMTERVVWLDQGKVVAEGPTAEVLGRYAGSLGKRADPSGRPGRAARRMARDRGLYRWGAGGARVDEVDVREPGPGWDAVEISITYEATSLDKGIIVVGFMDDLGRDIGSATSLPISLGQRGVMRCLIRPAPFRSGIYFPVAAILSMDGRVQDRWRLDRAIVVDREDEGPLADDFGPVAFSAGWTEE
jgi:lipopolysaccharide transport system ATP-binding protein